MALADIACGLLGISLMVDEHWVTYQLEVFGKWKMEGWVEATPQTPIA